MLLIKDINSSEPYKLFNKYFNDALQNNQSNINAIAVSSFDSINSEIESRFVNLRYIHNEEWTFFSNYNSTKAKNFATHNKISALFYWNSINLQIRIKAKIEKSSDDLSDIHYSNRDPMKNALAVSSNQSKPIDSYEQVVRNYKKAYSSIGDNSKRPEYWGGYSFTPYYFEFWKGHESRLNKRDAFELINKRWRHTILQP